MKNYFLLLIMVFSFVLSCNSQSSWIVKKGEVGNFCISFPNTPTYSQGSFHGWRANDKNGQVIYLMAYVEAPPSGKMTLEVAEKYLLPSMLKGDIEVSKNYLTYSNSNAMDFLYKTAENPIMFKQGRIIIRGQKVYILQVHYYHKNLSSFEQFASSLKFF